MTMRECEIEMRLRFSVSFVQEGKHAQVIAIRDLMRHREFVQGYSRSLVLNAANDIFAESEGLQLYEGRLARSRGYPMMERTRK
jgi:hypothetical protein